MSSNMKKFQKNKSQYGAERKSISIIQLSCTMSKRKQVNVTKMHICLLL